MTKPNRTNSALISVRTTRERLARQKAQALAFGMTLNAYINWLFDRNLPIPTPRRNIVSVEDKAALAQALALLGKSHLANNLNQLARLANSGALIITPETEAELTEARAYVRSIRDLLLKALGHRVEDRT